METKEEKDVEEKLERLVYEKLDKTDKKQESNKQITRSKKVAIVTYK